MIDWSSIPNTEPPILKDFSIDEVKLIGSENKNLLEIPCHTQAVRDA